MKTVSWLAAVLLVTGPALALAQPAPAGPNPAGGGSAAAPAGAPHATGSLEDAKAHYEKGLAHYNLGEWEAAIREFRASYEISQKPGLLFNIAQAYRLDKNFEQASYFYRTYLRLMPNAPNRAEVEQRIHEMEKSLAEQRATASSPPQGTMSPEGGVPHEPAPPAGTTSSSPAAPHGAGPASTALPAASLGVTDAGANQEHGGARGLRIAGIATAGAGGALLVTGLIFGNSARSAEHQLDALGASGGTWTSADQHTYDVGRRDNTIAIAAFAVGGAAVATGIALYSLGYLHERDARFAVAPTAHGVAFAAGWSF